ncbi:hypothetical protein BKA80DRAFT_311438 [Phyllosticta citrichinensis]
MASENCGEKRDVPTTVDIVCGKDKFTANRLRLAQKSSHFNDVLTSEEDEEGEAQSPIELDDEHDATTMAAVVAYVNDDTYPTELPDADELEMHAKLQSAAWAYAIDDLEQLATSKFATRLQCLDVETKAHLLELLNTISELYSKGKGKQDAGCRRLLRDMAVKCVADNVGKVRRSEAFDDEMWRIWDELFSDPDCLECVYDLLWELDARTCRGKRKATERESSSPFPEEES